jgi:BioD-like phosphotransacetylase family protein
MSEVEKIKNEQQFVRDKATGAVLNVDNSSLAKYKRQREKAEEMNEEIRTLKEQMSNIEQLLTKLVNRETDK